MTDAEYDDLLKITPEHLSEEFIEFLRTNKPEAVVEELTHWIVVKNVKYNDDSTGYEHWTAFYKRPAEYANEIAGIAWADLYNWMPKGRQLLVNRDEDRTITRFHLHIIK